MKTPSKDSKLDPNRQWESDLEDRQATVTDLFLVELIDRYDAAPGAHWCGRTVVGCLRELQKRRADETTDWHSIARARGEVLDKLSDQIAALKKAEMSSERGRTSMTATEWYPTPRLQWGKDGKLKQEWRRDTTEYRTYNGNPTPRRCDGVQAEWRDIPAESEK